MLHDSFLAGQCKVFTFLQAALPYSFVQRFACSGVPNQLIRHCHVQATGQELKIGDKGVKRFPLCLTSSIKFNCRHNRILLRFEVCFELSDNSLKNVFLTYILCTFSRSDLHSSPLESQVNFSASVSDEAHKIAYFFLLSAFAEWSSELEFTVLIKPFPFFTQVCSGPVHSWPIKRRIGVSFGHPNLLFPTETPVSPVSTKTQRQESTVDEKRGTSTVNMRGKKEQLTLTDGKGTCIQSRK